MEEKKQRPERPSPEPREGEDPFNLVTTAVFEEGKIVEQWVDEIGRDAFGHDPTKRKEVEDPVEEQPPEKIHPVLREWLGERPEDDFEILMINFRDDIEIPRFPEPVLEEPRDSKANQERMAQAEQMIEEIQNLRAERYEQIAAELQERYNAELVNSFWLINGVVVKMPLGAVYELAERDDVWYIEPEDAGEEPPQDTVASGRSRIVSDPYFNLGQTGGYIGLLDTGVRFSHTLFTSPSHIDFRYDCTDGTCNNVPDPGDDCWNHGTCSAAIITGNNNLGNDYRGVTGITLDSFKVYPGECGGLNGTAVVKAFEKALAILDRVIVAEMQSGGSPTGSISTAADSAFDAGAVIIAANGNNGPAANTVNAPANAQKVIGVGAFDVQTLNTPNYQSRGSAPDGRYKPDIQAPTNTETASSASDTALKHFGGTSGATPYGAGAAALLRNWLRGSSFSIDPGQVYAQMIISGQDPYPFNNNVGAGRLRLPVNGHGWWGKVSIGDGDNIDISLNISGDPPNILDAALWWPETPAQTHNDVDLYLIDPDGVIQDSSISSPSIFERARVEGSVTTGTWKLRIRGYDVSSDSQTVYWSAVILR